MLLIEQLLKLNEKENLDFKIEYNGSSENSLIHDILSMANTPYEGERFIVFGISDRKEIIGLEKHINSNDINNFLVQAPFNIPFSVQIKNEVFDGKNISILIIPENKGDIYVLRTPKYGLHANHIYTRNGDTNTGKTATTDPHTIERILKKKFKSQFEDSSKKDFIFEENNFDVFDEFHKAIKDWRSWATSSEFDYLREDDVTTYFYRKDMKFIIKEYDYMKEFSEPWAQAAIDPRASASKLELHYDKVKIKEEILVYTDGARFKNVIPHTAHFEHEGKYTFYYYYVVNTIKNDLNILVNDGQIGISRTPRGSFPVFNSHEEADELINKDFYSEDRLILSFTGPNGETERYNYKFPVYEEFPKMREGKILAKPEYEKLYGGVALKKKSEK